MPGTGCSNLKSGWTRPLWAGARGVHPKEILGVTKLPDDAEGCPERSDSGGPGRGQA
jgi:hypothetical protein